MKFELKLHINDSSFLAVVVLVVVVVVVGLKGVVKSEECDADGSVDVPSLFELVE